MTVEESYPGKKTLTRSSKTRSGLPLIERGEEGSGILRFALE
jgi:hypothetical protein